MDIVAGTVLRHSYRLIEPIGEGGMARVWLAHHIALDRNVAVKLITNEAISDAETRARFELEARTTAKVESPHVVRILDFDFTESGLPFMVLELLVGETLEERILRAGPVSLGEAKQLLAQTIDALVAAHACGILHRDIKAENLFLQASHDRAIDLKLLDFGIALGSTKIDHFGPLGTPQYMSPEQITDAAALTAQSDLFSLGVCMYYALTGEFPFGGSTFEQIAAACLRGTFVPPTALRAALPAPLDAWFRRALALQPTERFSSPAAMRDAFVRASIVPALRSLKETPLALELDRPIAMGPTDARSRGPQWLLGGLALAACIAVALTRSAPPASIEVSADPPTTSSTVAASLVELRAPTPASRLGAPPRVAPRQRRARSVAAAVIADAGVPTAESAEVPSDAVLMGLVLTPDPAPEAE